MAISELPIQNLPEWIANAKDRLGEPPLAELLSGSVYYPACGFDGRPVRFLAGNFHSFVYVDYGVTRADLLQRLQRGGQQVGEQRESCENLGFLGYHLLAYRDVREDELTPNGWTPRRLQLHDRQFPRGSPRATDSFAIWAIMERIGGFGDEHGPPRFSFLNVCGDGVASFDAMYCSNNIAPAVVAVIHPGTGDYPEWNAFENANSVFARRVNGNPFGHPEYLLFGGWGGSDFFGNPCWPEYQELVRMLVPTTVGVWRRTAN
jgi:hypothetical protein